ncbi:hypothetical protein AB0N17_45495 [Streptomyces sp. NPDC051133]|uniref:hypothetical protein n=1 Tax=Streptomyces sp. NPDC051133 TaxID=3155521 RepID=UPI003425F718
MGDDLPALCQFSLDGVNFYDSVKLNGANLKPTDDGKVHIQLRARGGGIGCIVSLASYLTHGATFAASGKQVLVGFDTVALRPGKSGSLDIAVPRTGCFEQIDLYTGQVKFDGKLHSHDGHEHGPLPKGPDVRAIKDDILIAAWNGGTKDCTSKKPSPSPTSSASSQPSVAAQEGATLTSAPSDPDAVPMPKGGSENLAPTGGIADLANTGAVDSGLLAGSAAVLLAGGAAIVVAMRRKRGGTRG